MNHYYNHKEKIIKNIFEIGLFFKWIITLLQIIGGMIILFINQNTITRWIILITQEELAEDSRDYIASHLLQFGTHFLVSTKIVISVYLISHGIIKFYLLYNLWKERLHVYPLSALVFSLFLLYQIYRYQFTHSIWLLVLSAFDVVYIYLILHEYKLLKKRELNNGS